GEPDRPPVKVGVPVTDLTAALFGSYAVLSALRARDIMGEGQICATSMLEAALPLQIWETSGYFANGIVPDPLGSAHRTSAPYQALRTSDGYVTIGAISPRNWTSFSQALGLEHLENDERFATNAARRARYEELAELIEEVTIT